MWRKSPEPSLEGRHKRESRSNNGKSEEEFCLFCSAFAWFAASSSSCLGGGFSRSDPPQTL
ncbi:unnamed protein product [Arabidopsis halleri]